jgi:hypothetical protein
VADGKPKADAQISANDLALYLVSSDVGKLGIIRRNKYPSKHIVSPYQDGKKWIVRFLSNDARDRTILASGIEHFEHLAQDTSTIPSKREDAKRTITALNAILTGYNALELGKLTFKSAPRLNPLMIKGVRVSTNLDLLTSVMNKGVEQQGGAILRLTQADESDKRDEMGGYTATPVLMQIEDKKPGVGEPLARICLAIDVQNKAKYEARAGASRRRANIEAACTMIKSIWPSV